MMRYKPVCSLISFYALLPTMTCHAQTPEQPPRVPAFNQLFKQPTGQNGYEELVLAGDLLDQNTALDTVQEAGATLTAKRRALADPDLQRALALLRTGLDKPITSARPTIDYSTTLPEYSRFRALARLLATEQYVLLADGQTERAIQNLRDGLRLGRAARTDHLLISELVGIAIDRIAINQLLKHLDQLSEHNCDSLLKLIDEWLGSEHSAIPALLRERDSAVQALEQVRKTPASAMRELFANNSGDEDPAEAQLAATFAANPAAVGQAIDRARALIDGHCDALIASLQLPPWQRPEVKMPTGDSPGHRLFQMISPNYDSVLDKFILDHVNLQMLGVHVAIRRYRWQYDRLTDRLEQLRLESLTIDPYTGKTLGYQRKGDNYEIFSVGSYDHDDNGARIPGKRKPITL